RRPRVPEGNFGGVHSRDRADGNLPVASIGPGGPKGPVRRSKAKPHHALSYSRTLAPPHLCFPYNPPVNQEVFAAVADALERGEAAALVTIVSTLGSTPQRVGAKMLVFGDGRIVGTIGGGCYENDAFWKARDAITNRRPQLVHYELSDDF